MILVELIENTPLVSGSLSNTLGEPTATLNKGHFTPRGRADLLCKRLKILTCNWPKG
jgi:hypothetical protein